MKQTVLVTGSSRGIGKEIAIYFAKKKYQVILHASGESEQLKITEKEIKKLGNLLLTVCFDISNKSAVEKACTSMLKRIGKVDVLVNNAGINRDRTFIKMSFEEWDQVLKTNLYGPFFVTQQVLPKMKEQMFGRIINISSIVALKGNFGQTNYAASKAGLIGMGKSLAREVAKYNITVNTICPGLITSNMTAKIPEDYAKHLLSQIALNRMGSPEEVANLVGYIASPESSYITGAVIDINGGWL